MFGLQDAASLISLSMTMNLSGSVLLDLRNRAHQFERTNLDICAYCRIAWRTLLSKKTNLIVPIMCSDSDESLPLIM